MYRTTNALFPFQDKIVPPRDSDKTLTDYMQSAIFAIQKGEEKHLHDQTLELPFYQRLFTHKTITTEELLLHFVNNAAIFKKLETLIKADSCFHKIVGDDIYRYEQVEKDITFFTQKFNLPRPEITQEARDFLIFMEEVVQHDPQLLLAVFYVMYSGLFLGRVVCNSTIDWLKCRIPDWDRLPKDNRGVCYWDFRGLPEYKDLEARKKQFQLSINAHGDLLHLDKKMWAIARKTFEHNFRSIQSVSPRDLPQRNIRLNVTPMLQQLVFRCLFLIAAVFLMRKWSAS